MSAPETLRPRTAFTCPRCGWSGEFETRFPTWCLECTHGADPDVPAKPAGFWERRRKAAAARRHARLYQRLVSARHLRPTGLTRASAVAFAVLVHLTTLALLVGGIWLILFLPHTLGGWVCGPLLVLLAFGVRPRVPSLDKHARLVTRADAPELFRLLDAISDQMGAERFHGVAFDTRCNASFHTLGLRRLRVLTIGAPLWEVLRPQERVAVLAHEVAHCVNGDGEYGFVVGGALFTLRKWYAVTHPLTRVTSQSRLRTRSLLDLVLPIHLIYAGATKLLLRSKPRAEYLADQLAADIASTDALCESFERYMTAVAAMQVLVAALDARVPSHPWRMVRDYAAALPEHERRRLALLKERAGAAVDATHPPTHLRIRMLRERPALPGRLAMTAEWSAAMDAEIAPYFERLASRVTEFARR